MFETQIILELITLTFFSGLIINFLKKFKQNKTTYILAISPLAAFTTGFTMRLSGIKDWIDIGFFLTEFSYLFVWALFVLCAVLGQLKYWKVK